MQAEDDRQGLGGPEGADTVDMAEVAEMAGIAEPDMVRHPGAEQHRPRSRSVSGPGAPLARRPLLAVGSACLLSALVLGVVLGPRDGPISVDNWAWDAAQWSMLWETLNLLLADRAWDVIAALFPLGTPGVAIGLAVGLAVVSWWRAEPRVAATCLAGPITAVALTGGLLKPFFGRTYRDGLAYPSTHVTATLAAGTLLVVLAYRSGGLRRALAAAALWAVVVAVVVLHLLSRRLHYVTDIVGGVGVGAGVTLLIVGALLGQRTAASN